MTSPAPLAAAERQYAEQAGLSRQAVDAVTAAWQQLDAANPSVSWERDRIADRVYGTIAMSQELAASRADGYTDAVLADQGIDARPDGTVIPSSFAGIASDGRNLDDLLLQPIIDTAVAQSTGASIQSALSVGLSSLVRITATQVLDAGRVATGVTVATRGGIGWVRMLEPGACGRCAILAGRVYKYNAGFKRHFHCKCHHIPVSEDTPNDAFTDPMDYFRSLSTEQQNKAFTVSGAEAIRLGADPSQVVNARRGAEGLTTASRLPPNRERRSLERVDVYGRKLLITNEGITVRGVAGQSLIERHGAIRQTSGVATRITAQGPQLRQIHTQTARVPRLMPESILEIADDRADAVRMLRLYGYIR